MVRPRPTGEAIGRMDAPLPHGPRRGGTDATNPRTGKRWNAPKGDGGPVGDRPDAHVSARRRALAGRRRREVGASEVVGRECLRAAAGLWSRPWAFVRTRVPAAGREERAKDRPLLALAVGGRASAVARTTRNTPAGRNGCEPAGMTAVPWSRPTERDPRPRLRGGMEARLRLAAILTQPIAAAY